MIVLSSPPRPKSNPNIIIINNADADDSPDNDNDTGTFTFACTFCWRPTVRVLPCRRVRVPRVVLLAPRLLPLSAMRQLARRGPASSRQGGGRVGNVGFGGGGNRGSAGNGGEGEADGRGRREVVEVPLCAAPACLTDFKRTTGGGGGGGGLEQDVVMEVAVALIERADRGSSHQSWERMPKMGSPTRLAAAAGAGTRIRTRGGTSSRRDAEDKDGVRGVGRAPDSSTSTWTLPRRNGVLACVAPALLPRVVTAEPPVQSSPTSREEPQIPAPESSDSDVFASAREYPTPETAGPADKPNTPDEPSTPNEPHHVTLPGGANDNQAGKRTPMPGTYQKPENHASTAPTPPPQHPKQPIHILEKEAAQRPETAIADAGICGFFVPLRRAPRNRATPSAGSAARTPRSPSHTLESAPTRTARRPGGSRQQQRALRTRPRNRSHSRGTLAKACATRGVPPSRQIAVQRPVPAPVPAEAPAPGPPPPALNGVARGGGRPPPRWRRGEEALGRREARREGEGEQEDDDAGGKAEIGRGWVVWV
ncbi:hypothetical protein DL770_006194 [Monosporascus sp. CRB-9-2]|nr:hypothetical protein DL770_006194 [Monosporascus sp. CRB-9-2]